MNRTHLFLLLSLVIVAFCSTPKVDAQTDVVAFWGFTNDFDTNPDPVDPLAPDGPNRQNFAADVDNTVGVANLQSYLGNAGNLDDNGGGGFVPYTSPVSGATFGPSRTIRFEDLRGGGDDFDINGLDVFNVDRNDGMGALQDNFGNDALLYITLDGTGFQDFEIRFDAEGTPLDPDPDVGVAPESFLPTSFDIFYRTTGPGGTWFRDPDQNNISLAFSDLDPANPDPENQVADSGPIPLAAALNNNSQIEILIQDFANEGNGELEIDNIEIVANTVATIPEPASTGLIFMVGLGLVGLRRRK